MPRGLITNLLIVIVSAGVLYAAWQWGCAYASTWQVMAFALAFLSLTWSTMGAIAGAIAGPQALTGFRFAALLSAVFPAVIQVYVVILGLVRTFTDLSFGDQFFTQSGNTLNSEGIWSLAVLSLATMISYAQSRNRRLFCAAFWLVIIALVWWFLMMPAYRSTPAGGVVRTGSTLILSLSVASWCWLSVLFMRWRDRRSRWQQACRNPKELSQELQPWAGMSLSLVVVTYLLAGLGAFHIAVPIAFAGWSYGQSMFLAAIASTIGATGAFLHLAKGYHRGLTEATMLLTSLAFGLLAISTIPTSTEDLAVRYPSILAATIVGFSAASFLWAWLYGVWQQQLNKGEPWTVAGLMIPQTVRFSFMSASLAIVVGALLALWPRLGGISASDDSMMSMVSGIATNLFMILVTLWIARRFRRHTFHFLAILAVCSTLGFIVSRLYPFSPHFS